MSLEIATQFWPWDSIGNIVNYGRRALEKFPFDQIWMCDEFQYEDCTTILSSMAMNLDVSLGSMVTFPWRNPLELAQRFASISKLARPGKGVAIGIGAGGAVQVQVIAEKRNPAAVMRESVELLTGLLSGEEVELSRFPALAKRFRYNTRSKTRLYFPPQRKVPVFLAAGGPRLYEIAGRYADGVIFSQLVARTSLPGVRAGLLKQALESVAAAREEREPGRPFKKIYNLHISVSRDGKRAKQWAKRNSSYGLSGAYIRYPEVLAALGLDPEEVGFVAEAYTKGLGVEEAANRVSDDLLARAGNVVAGTPDECVEMCREIVRHITALGFDQLVMGVPLGPDVPEAIELIAEKVLPALELTVKES
jgi:alkanesulfonate monooxygenase SsuD/methylene tetrahydromethanopterin reductase-like flavin-dependent oxidoreductase (luciferase family)